MSTQGFRLDPSLLKLSPTALLKKYEASTPEERVRLGFIRRATPQEFTNGNQPKGAPADFGGAVYTSSTPPVVSDDTDPGIPVTPMPIGVSFQKQNATGSLHLDTSNPPTAELLQSGLRTVGTKMGQGQYSAADLSDSAPVGMGKFSAADLDEARPDFAKNPPAVPWKPPVNVEEVSDPLGAIKSAPATILNAVTGQPGAVSTDELAGKPQTGDETVQGLEEVATPGKRLRGTNRLTRAAMNEASRFLGPAAAENPLMVGRVLAGGTVGQQTGQEAAEASGANPDQAEAAGNVGAVLGGTAGGFDYSRAPAPEPSPGATTPPQAPPEVPPSAAPVDPNPSPGAAPLQMTPAVPKAIPEPPDLEGITSDQTTQAGGPASHPDNLRAYESLTKLADQRKASGLTGNAMGYSRAARAIRDLPGDQSFLAMTDEDLADLPGIGPKTLPLLQSLKSSLKRPDLPSLFHSNLESDVTAAPQDVQAEANATQLKLYEEKIANNAPDKLQAIEARTDLLNRMNGVKVPATDVEARAQAGKTRKMSQPRTQIEAPTETRKNLDLTLEDFLKARQLKRSQSGVPNTANSVPTIGPNADVVQAMRNGTYKWNKR